MRPRRTTTPYVSPASFAAGRRPRPHRASGCAFVLGGHHVEGKKHPSEHDWAWGWSLLRIGAWLRDGAGDAGGEAGEDAVDRWCAAAGRALHVDGRKVHTPSVAHAVLAEAGLDPAAVAAIADPRTHDVVRADHQRVAELGGFGVPTPVFSGNRALFGPVVREGPTGAAACACGT